MASINKKDLRLLKPGELVLTKDNLGLTKEDPEEFLSEEGDRPEPDKVITDIGDILLVLEDRRTTNIVPSVPGQKAKSIKVLYGKEPRWLYVMNYDRISRCIEPAKPAKK